MKTAAELIAEAKAEGLTLEGVTDDSTAAEIESAITAAKAKKAGSNAKPPWGDEENFDAERAWNLIKSLREDNGKLKSERDELRTTVKEHEDSTKTEQERLAEKAAADEARATSAETEAARLRVALKKGLTETQARRLVGASEEELTVDADALLADFRSEEDDDDTTRRLPRERTRPGAVPRAEPETDDPQTLAADVSRGGF